MSTAATKPKYLGLSNQGATCYMNSILQALFMTPEFRNGIFQWENPSAEGKPEECIPLQLQLLFGKLQLFKNRKFINTKPLITSFQWDPQEAFKQHDAQEFLTVLLDIIGEMFFGTKQENLISDLFNGTSEGYVRCKKCGYESITPDKYIYLSLVVKDEIEKVYNPTVEKGLENYLKPFMLEGDNKYNCDKCKEKVDAEKGVRFLTFPKVLILHLNRFELDFNTFSRRKLNHKVTFPKLLNLNRFLKPYDEIVKENALNPENQGVKVDENEYARYREERLKLMELAEKRYRKENIGKTYEDFEDIANKKRKTELDHIDRFDINNYRAADDNVTKADINKNRAVDDNLSKSEEQARKIDILADLRNSKKLFDEKVAKTQTPQKNETTTGDAKPVDSTQTNKTEEPKKENSSQPLLENIPERKTAKQETEEEKAEPADDLFEKFKNLFDQGKYVYDLYAVMIHSGTAVGGHYYTYIKSFEDEQWYNFNDSTVERISAAEVSKAFGDEKPRYDSGSSGYMLFYRMIEPDEKRDEIIELPEKLQKALDLELEADRIREEQEKIEKEMKEKELTIRVYYGDLDKKIVINRDETFRAFTEKARTELGIVEAPENWRLRLYSSFEGTMLDTYTGREDQSLYNLKIRDQRAFVVETKTSDEQFYDYDPKKITVKINTWRPGITDMSEKALQPKKIYIDDSATLKELMVAIESITKIPIEKQLVMKRNAYMASKYSDILNKLPGNIDKTFSYHRIFNGINIYVEESDVPIKEVTKTKWDNEFELDKHRVNVKFNDPRANIENVPPEYSLSVLADDRQTVYDLKMKISDLLDLPANEFIMKKGGKFGNELRDHEAKLLDVSITNLGNVFLELGTPTKSGEYKIAFAFGCLSPEAHDGLIFFFEDLFELTVQNMETVHEVKVRLANEMQEKARGFAISVDEMRLRERNADTMGQILHDEKRMKEYSLYDRKVIIIERCEKKQEIKPTQLMTHLKFWNPIDFELSPPVEILIDRENCKLLDIGKIASEKFGVAIENVEGYKVKNVSAFNRVDLLSDEGDKWTKLHGNVSLAGQHPWYMHKDGSLIIIRDGSLKLDQDQLGSLKEKESEAKRKRAENNKTVDFIIPINTSYVKETGVRIGVKKPTTTKDDSGVDSKKDSDSGPKKSKDI